MVNSAVGVISSAKSEMNPPGLFGNVSPLSEHMHLIQCFYPRFMLQTSELAVSPVSHSSRAGDVNWY